MKNYRLLFFAFLVIINFTNCENDDITEITTENPDTDPDQDPDSDPDSDADPDSTTFDYDFGNDVNRNFIGRIVNENNQALASVTITIGDASTLTDINGMFTLNNVTVKENFAYIKASLSGFFDGSRSVIPIDGENRIDIMLRERNTIVRESGEAFVLGSGAYSVSFSGNYETEDGSPYTGSVNISSNYLSPADENLNDLMPGMLLGQGITGEANVLETYGMLTVELTGTNNEKLQIVSDSELTFPIADQQLSSAPSTIPLWYFDEENGYWIEEGEATRVGDQYVGTVSHFTPWNVDIPLPMTKIDLTVLDQNNGALPGVNVYAIPNGGAFSRIFTTNQDGKACGLVPANQSITIEVIGLCGESLTSINVGPFMEDSVNVIPPMIITEMLATLIEITGVLKQCDNSDVTNGYVILDNSEQDPVFYTVSNGDFTFNTFLCDGATTFTLEGYDVENSQSTGEHTYTFVAPITDIGSLMTCIDVDEYVIYTLLNGINNPTTTLRFQEAPFDVSFESDRLLIENSDGSFIMDFKPSEGVQFSGLETYEADPDFIFRHHNGPPNVNWRLNLGTNILVITNEMNLNFVEIGEVGEYIIFTFEGEHEHLYDDDVVIRQRVTGGTVRVLRDQ